MGIDGIGKKPPSIGGAGHVPGVATPKPTGEASAPFAVGPAEAARVGGVGGAAPSSPLERLRAGEIDANEFVDLKLDEATKHLSGLAPDRLEAIRDELRHRLLTDPSLVDLFTQATGVRPAPPEG